MAFVKRAQKHIKNDLSGYSINKELSKKRKNQRTIMTTLESFLTKLEKYEKKLKVKFVNGWNNEFSITKEIEEEKVIWAEGYGSKEE